MNKPSLMVCLLSCASLAGCPDDASMDDAGPDVAMTDGGGVPPDAGPAPDAFVAPDVGGAADGVSCSSDVACASGHCVDGVCCDTACDGECVACIEVLTGGASGTCAAVLASDPEGECEATGCTTGECGASGCAVVASGTECRAAAGACDVAETCDGSSPTCPADGVAPIGTECRASVGVCDPAETCDGSAADCPGDERAGVGTVCRASAGACDEDEVCDGSSGVCPADIVMPAGTAIAACSPYLCGGSATCPASCASHADCAGGTVCSGGVCARGYRMFVTQSTFGANFGSIAAADARCRAAADAAALPGHFRAWLSVAGSSASARLEHVAGPIYRMDGSVPRVIASNWDDLVDGVSVAIATDEYGVPHPNAYVWTGTTDAGAATGSDCAGWTSSSAATFATSGNASAAAFSTFFGAQACNRSHRLYCLEQTMPPPG